MADLDQLLTSASPPPEDVLVPALAHALEASPERLLQLLYRLDLPETAVLPILARAHATPHDREDALRALARCILATLHTRAQRRARWNAEFGIAEPDEPT